MCVYMYMYVCEEGREKEGRGRLVTNLGRER